MTVPSILLILLCAPPVGLAFGLVGGGGVWYVSESQRARHGCSGTHQQQGTGIGLTSWQRAFASASGRISRPPGTALFARPKPTDEEMEQRKEQLRVLLSASKEKIDKLVRQNPSVIIRSDIEKNHGPKLKLLQERLGVSEGDAGKMCLTANRLLTNSLATSENRMDWLQARLNLNKSQLRKIVERGPAVLALSRETLEKKMDWLQARLNLNKSQLRTIVKRDPIVLTLSINGNLEPTIDNIQSSVDLSDKELTKIFVKSPDVLRFNMSAENIKQRLSLLQEILDLPEVDIGGLRKCIITRPKILFWKEESMKESQQWIQQRFGLGDARIALMCRSRSQLLSSNTTTLGDNTNSIQAVLSLSDDELSDLVSKFPAILCCYSIEENIKPKLRYLRTRFELDDDALKHLVLKAPSLFSLPEGNIEEKLQFYSTLVGEREAKRLVIKSSSLLRQSLEKRLKPRLEEVKNSGVKVRWNETLIQRLAIRTPDQWEKYKLGEARRGGAAS